MRVQDYILKEWKESKISVFVMYKEYDVINQVKGELIDFDDYTITISSYKNFVIINRKQILKMKGSKKDGINRK